MTNRELGVEVTMMIESVLSSLENLLEAVTGLPEGQTIELNLDDKASLGVEEITDKINDLAGMQATVGLDAENNISDVVNEALNNIEEIDGTTAEAILEAVDHVTNITSDVESSLENIDGMVATSEVNVDGDAPSVLDEISGQLDDLEGRSVDVEVGVTDTSTIDDTNEKLEETEESGSDLGSSIGSMILSFITLKGVSDSFAVDRQLKLANYYGQGTNQTLEEMRNKVNSLTSASMGPESIAEAMRLMGEGGLNANEQLKLIGPVVDIIKTKGGDLGTVSKYMTNQMNLYGWSADEAAGKTNLLNAAILNSNLETGEYINILKRLALSADALGLSFEEKTGIINALNRSGVEAVEINRALRGGFTRFRKEIDPLDGKLTDAEKAMQSMGISMTDANGKVKTQRQLLMEVMDKLSQMPQGYEKTKLATTIFGDTTGGVFSKLKESPTEYINEINRMATETETAMKKTSGVTKEGVRSVKIDTLSWVDYIKKYGNQLITYMSSWPKDIRNILAVIGGYLGLKGVLRFIPGGIGKKIADKIGLTWLENNIKSSGGKVGSATKGFIKSILSNIPGLSKLMGEGGGKIGSSLLSGIWNSIKNGAPKVLGKIPSFLKSLLGKFNVASIWTTDMFPETVPQGTKGSAEREQWIQEWKRGEHPGSLVKTEKAAREYEGTWDTLQQRYNQIKKAYNDFKAWLDNLPRLNWNMLLGGLATTPKISWSGLKTGLPSTTSWIQDKINGLKAWLLGNKPQVPRLGWNNLQTGLDNANLGIKIKVTNLRNWIPANKPKIPKLGWSALQTGLKGVTDGIKYRIINLETFLKNRAPVMKKAGYNVMLGLAAGINKGKPALEDALKGISAYFPQSPPRKGPLRTIWYTGAWADVGAQLAGALQKGYDTSMKSWSSGQEYASPSSTKIVIPAPSNWSGSMATNIARQVASYSKIPETKTAIGMNWNQIKDQFKNLTTNTAGLSTTIKSSAKSLGDSIGSLAKPMNTLSGLLTPMSTGIGGISGGGGSYDPIGAYNRTVPSVVVTGNVDLRPSNRGAFGDTPSTKATAKTVGNIYGSVKSIAQDLPKGILYGGSVARAVADAIPTAAMNAALPVGTLYGYGQSVPSTVSDSGGDITVEKQEINVNLYDAQIRNEEDIKKLSKSLARDIDQQAISRGVRSVDLVR